MAAALTGAAISCAASAAADNTTPLCSQVEYRTEHLRECNMQDSPVFFGGTPGDGNRGCDGLCGVVDGVLGSIGLGGLLG